MITFLDTYKNKRVLVTGASGFVGEHLIRKLSGHCAVLAGTFFTNSIECEGAQLTPVDLRDQNSVSRLFRDLKPDVIFNCAAITRVGFCEEEPESAEAGIISVLENLLTARDEYTPDARMITLSTDMVFDGSHAPYSETDQTNPISNYGKLKAQADELFLSKMPGTIIRPALIYGLPSTHQGSFLAWMIESLLKGQELTLFEDEYRTPILIDDLTDIMMAAASKSAEEVPRLLHAGGSQKLNRVEMGMVLCEELGADPELIKISQISGSTHEKTRPKDLALNSNLAEQTFARKNQSFVEGIKSIFSAIDT